MKRRLTERDLTRIVKRVINESFDDYISKYNQSDINQAEREGDITVEFYPGTPGGHAFTIADRVDVQSMRAELKEKGIIGMVVFGPDYHRGGTGREPKSMSVLLYGPEPEEDREKVYKIIRDNPTSFSLNYPHW